MKEIIGKPLAFMSYAHIDDEISGEMLKEVRDKIKKEIFALSGSQDFEIYFDRDNLETSRLWQLRINQALDGATFLIPIITPSLFNSEECRNEITRFLAREERLKCKETIFPIYFIEVRDYSKESTDELVREMAIRQYADFRQFRLDSLNTKEAREAISKLGQEILKRAEFDNVRGPDENIKGYDVKYEEKSPKQENYYMNEKYFEEKILKRLVTSKEFYIECEQIHETNSYVSVLSKTPGLIIPSEGNLTDFRKNYFKTIERRLLEGEGNYNLRYLFDKEEFINELFELIKNKNYDLIEEIRLNIKNLLKYSNLDLRIGNTIPLTGSVLGGSRIACIGFKEEDIKKIAEGVRITVPEILKIIIYQYNELFTNSEELNEILLEKIIKEIQKVVN